MSAELLMTPDEVEAFLASRAEAHKKVLPWKRKSYAHLRCQPGRLWRAGTKSVEVEGLGRGLVGYERIDGTIDVRFHIHRIQKFLEKQKGKV